MSSTLSLIFLASIIWFFISLKKDKKSKGKITKRTWRILIVTAISFFLFGVTAPKQDQKSTHRTSDQSAKSTNKEKPRNKTSSSKSKTSKSSSESSSSDTNKKTPSTILKFSGNKQLVLGDLDSLSRATYAHIQLRDKDEPKEKRTNRLEVNPVGWHNFKFYYGDGSKQAWLMNRGHLIGYQFSGLNDEIRNLVPETAWMNAGNYSGMNDSNQDSMLYYENRLDSWLSTHPNYWLDYLVVPIYKNSELIPRQIKLSYIGLDSNGKIIQIKLGSSKEQTDTDMITHVTLENVSPNATIDYATGRATNTVTKQTVQSAPPASSSQQSSNINENSDRTVYVTGGGNSDVYWYSTSNMPANTNMNNLVTMTEAQAIAQGKRHSARE